MSGRSGANLHYTQTPRHGEQQAYKQLCVDAERRAMSARVRFIHRVFLCSAVNTLLFQGGNVEQELGGRETNTSLKESQQVGGRSASSLTPQRHRVLETGPDRLHLYSDTRRLLA